MTFRQLLKSILFLLGTFLHELAHYAAAAVFGKAEKFSVIPRREKNAIVFGYTVSSVRYRVFNAFVAAAPLLWWAVLYLGLRYLILPDLAEIAAEPRLAWERMRHASPFDIVYLWLILQLFWAGKLSGQDCRVFFRGVFSASGFVFLAAVAGLVAVILLRKA